MSKNIPAEKDDEVNETAPARVEVETVNSASALWTKNKDDISAEDYNEFYKHSPTTSRTRWSTFTARSKALTNTYVPGRAPFDLWGRDAKHGVKLYIKKSSSPTTPNN